MSEDRLEHENDPADAPGGGAASSRPTALGPAALGTRLARMRRARGSPVDERGGRGIGLVAVVAVLAATGGGGAYLLAVAREGEEDDGLTASQVEAFQSARSTEGRIAFPLGEPTREPGALRIPASPEEPTPPTPTPAAARSDDGLALEVAELREALRESERMREAEARDRAAASAAALEEARELFEERREKLAGELSDLRQEMATARREAGDLQAALDAERDRGLGLAQQLADRDAQLADDALESERRLALQQERRMREAASAELLERQVTSPAVVFAEGAATGARDGASPASSEAAGAADDARPTASEAYLASAPPLVVQQARRMTDPDRTLAQGSVIQAVLQTAVSSELPGNVLAVVSEPVPAFSGDAVLIPRGSRLFGSYRAGYEAGQRRVLIRWSRILTPDGTSMEISSVGSDRLGRSGLSGFVDNRLRERLGTAALISVITTAPGLAASGGGEGTDLVLQTGDDMGGEAASALDRQLAIPPTIHVDQGVAVTVIVDRDVIVR